MNHTGVRATGWLRQAARKAASAGAVIARTLWPDVGGSARAPASPPGVHPRGAHLRSLRVHFLAVEDNPEGGG